MGRTAQFRVRISGTRWEETPVVAQLECDSNEEASKRASRIASTVEREVRWNWEGMVQGHYIGGGWRLRNQAMDKSTDQMEEMTNRQRGLISPMAELIAALHGVSEGREREWAVQAVHRAGNLEKQSGLSFEEAIIEEIKKRSQEIAKVDEGILAALSVGAEEDL